jgi:hypothetical protein
MSTIVAGFGYSLHTLTIVGKMKQPGEMMPILRTVGVSSPIPKPRLQTRNVSDNELTRLCETEKDSSDDKGPYLENTTTLISPHIRLYKMKRASRLPKNECMTDSRFRFS